MKVDSVAIKKKSFDVGPQCNYLKMSLDTDRKCNYFFKNVARYRSKV